MKLRETMILKFGIRDFMLLRFDRKQENEKSKVCYEELYFSEQNI